MPVTSLISASGENVAGRVHGAHQRLTNGPEGEIVWEFINRYDAKSVAIVSGAAEAEAAAAIEFPDPVIRNYVLDPVRRSGVRQGALEGLMIFRQFLAPKTGCASYLFG
jgi:hypothetical protein